MSEYGIYEAKTKLPALIKQVQNGGQVTSTNRGTPVVDIVLSISRTKQQTQKAIVAIKAMRSTETINQELYSEMRLRGRR